MRLDFRLYGRRPVSRSLDSILASMSENGFEPTALSLQWTQVRELDRGQAVELATGMPWGTCGGSVPGGRFEITWNYGPRAWLQSVWMDLDSSEVTPPRLAGLLVELARLVGGVYGYVDSREIVEEDSRAVGGMLLREESLVGVYWLNYLGPEIVRQLPLDDALAAALPLWVRDDEGGIVFSGAKELGQRDTDLAARVAQQWPIFSMLDPKARFPTKLQVDLREVRGLAGHVSQTATTATLVRDVDQFLEKVRQRATDFIGWCGSRGLSCATEEDFQRVFPEHQTAIRGDQELLEAAIAAYGESIRLRIGGTWRKSRFIGVGEPIIAVPWRPWATRRVVIEVLQLLEEPGV